MAAVDGEKNRIYYRKGYKYQLGKYYGLFIGGAFAGLEGRVDGWVVLKEGVLHFRQGYAWDGCSGPTRDDRTNMRGGLVHDGLSQLMRHGQLPRELRKEADILFRRILREDGMGPVRALAYYNGVRIGGAKSVTAAGRRVLYYAP